MMESAGEGLPETPETGVVPEPENGLDQFMVRIATLQQTGAGNFDAARLYYLEVLLRRAVGQQGGARKLLLDKLDKELTLLQSRFSAARTEAGTMLAAALAGHPQASAMLQGLYDSGDFATLKRRMANLDQGAAGTSLSVLVRDLEQHVHFTANPDDAGLSTTAVSSRPGQPAVRPAAETHANPARGELKTLRKFRSTWSRLSSDKRMAQALDQAPRNAGPANPHMLILRSLELMQEISPDYLTRFISYADTLLCLDAGEREKAAPPKKARAPRATGKKSA